MEPPGGTELERRIVTGEWRELARVRALVERKDDDRQRRIVAEAIEQRTQRSDVIGGGGDVGADVRTEAIEQRRVVITPGAGMDLQHELVVETHARHLGEHLSAE